MAIYLGTEQHCSSALSYPVFVEIMMPMSNIRNILPSTVEENSFWDLVICMQVPSQWYRLSGIENLRKLRVEPWK